MKNSLRWQWFYQKRIYLLIFFVPIVIMFLTYAVFGVHPFGDESALVLDLNGQYVYYYEAFRDAVWGNGSLIYSWSRNLSGEMFGIIGYYLASPFMIVPVLLPRSMMLYSVEIMELLKVGTCGVTFGVYLRNRKECKPFTMVTFSVIYALSGYVIVNLMNPMWLDGVIYLPLIIMGVEKLYDKGNKLGLIIPLALAFIANFYIGYMIGLFTAFYFVYYYFHKEDMLSRKETFKAILRFFISALVAILCSMIIIYPVWNSLKLGKLEFTKPDFSYSAQFTYVKMLSKLLPLSYDTVRPEGLPNIYCGVITIILIPLYFMNKNIKARQKISNGAMLAFLTLIMYVRPLDIAMHGFQVPNWLPFRYSFAVSFMLLIIAAEAFEHLEGITLREIGGTFVALMAFVIFLENKRYSHLFTAGAILVSMLFLVIYYGLLYALKKKNSNTVRIAIVMLTCIELFSNCIYTVVSIDNDVVYSTYSSYVPYVKQGRKVMSQIESLDSGLYRTEATFRRTVNDPMAFGMKGISHSSSNMNAPVIDFINNLGFNSRGHYTGYAGATKVTDSIFGIKYLMNKDQDVYDYREKFTSGDTTVYENPYALSVGFMADNDIRKLYMSNGNPFINQNRLLGSLVGTTDQDYFKQIDNFNIDYNNVSVSYAGNDIKYTPTQEGVDASVTFSFPAPTDDIIYAFFPSNHERRMEVTVNGKPLAHYFESDYYTIIQIGKFEKNENVQVEMTLTQDEAYMVAQYFYYLDTSKYQDALAKIKQNEWNITKFSDTYLEGDITAEDNQVMMTTIPYEKGWTVHVDGKEVKPVKLGNAFIGVNLSEGKHTVTMKFMPKYFIAGIFMSLAGLILVVAIGIIDRHRNNKLLKSIYK